MLPDLKVGLRSAIAQFHLLSYELRGSFNLLQANEIIFGQ